MFIPLLARLRSGCGALFVATAGIAIIASGMGMALGAAEPPSSGFGNGVPPGMVLIPGGIQTPLFRLPDEPREVTVRPFLLDIAPVTNAGFLEFVRQNPRWRRSQVRRLFADAGYLRHWSGDLDLGPEGSRVALQPVVQVSWFAAKAYAAWKGCRLPTTAEWELAASVGFTRVDGTNDAEFQLAITRWYGTPSPAELPAVRSGRPTLQGVYDLHGLVWEWTGDFNSALVTGDSRGDTGMERQLFCGAAALGAGDRSNFPAFMRTGFRSSLKAAYTIHNLGFRCAADPPPTTSSRP